VLSFAALGSFPACGGGDDDSDGSGGAAGAGSGGTLTGVGGTAGRGGSGTSQSGASGRGGSGTSQSGASGRGGSGTSQSGTGGKSAPVAGTSPNSGGSDSVGGSMNGDAGAPNPPGGSNGDSPYEIECHGDTVMCGDPTALLCLGLRVETEVFGYSCSNECESDSDCSTLPASADATAGCVDFVNNKYCLLVCKDGDEEASCPTGMYCYVYEGATIGYCLWH
jgi:hypothetical protein